MFWKAFEHTIFSSSTSSNEERFRCIRKHAAGLVDHLRIQKLTIGKQKCLTITCLTGILWAYGIFRHDQTIFLLIFYDIFTIILTVSKTRFLDDFILSLGEHFEYHTKFKTESHKITATSIESRKPSILYTRYLITLNRLCLQTYTVVNTY